MKREEKNLQSRQKILNSALQEFGEKGYGLSSINTICSNGGISKGIIYHYFKDKDSLYLACIEECFKQLTDYLQNHTSNEYTGIEKRLKEYFSARLEFFNQYPVYQKLFCSAVISPPKHLSTSITQVKEPFDSFNTAVLKGLLEQSDLRKDITIDEVVEVFRIFQDFANAHMQMDASDNNELKKAELTRENLLLILLYGILERS